MPKRKTQEIMVHTLESKLIKTVFEEVQILELLDKTFNKHLYARTKENHG